MGTIIAIIVWGLVWGYATKTVNENKGYEGGFWLGFIGFLIVVCKSDNHHRDN